MRVVINRQPTLGARTGIGHYAAELVRALVGQAGRDEIHVYPTGLVMRLHAWVAGSAPLRVPLAFGGAPGTKSRERTSVVAGPISSKRGNSPRLGMRKLLRCFLPVKHCHFQNVCRRNRFDLYHEPNILPMPCDLPTIATMHDLSAILNPQWHPADRVKQHQKHLHRALRQCAHFITGSDHTRAEIIRELGVAPERVTRVYHGIRAGLSPLPPNAVAAGLEALGLPLSYLLHVGTLEPRKNLEMLARAYCDLPVALRERCPLLLVGKWGWNTASLAAFLEAKGYQRGVRHVGYVAEEHLPVVYNGARALVYPSFYEGFGLPPLEMMACGGAVLASTTGAVAEVVGPCAHLIDPNDREGWREAMRRVILDDNWRQELRSGVLQWAAPFTWQECAAATLRVYRQVLGFKRGGSLAA